MGKYIKKSKNKRRSRKIKLKDIIAGAFSPVSASRKIQNLARSRTRQQSIKRDTLQSLFSQGAAKYKKALQTMDFRGINLDSQVLSRRVLDKANFEKVSFKNAKLNGCKLNGTNCRGARFIGAELKKTAAVNTNFKDCNFESANLSEMQCEKSNFTNAKFVNSNLTKLFAENTDFKDCNFELANLTGIKCVKSNFTNAKFDNCNIYNTIFSECNLQNSTIKLRKGVTVNMIKHISLKGCNINNLIAINNPTIINAFNDVITPLLNITVNNDERQITFDTVISNKEFIGCSFKNVVLKKGTISSCEFTDCIFTDSQFYSINFIVCKFQNCKFINFRGHSSNYVSSKFIDCNLEKADLRSSVFKEMIFRKCNLKNSDFTGTKFLEGGHIENGCNLFQSKMIQCTFDRIRFSQDVNLREVDFQSSVGLQDFNFRGMNMEAARLTGVILNNSDFRDTNLRGVQFDFAQIYGCNFTGANLQNANINVAEGRYETVGIPDDQEDIGAVDTHKTFYNMNINGLMEFYKKYCDIDMARNYVDNDALIDDTLALFRNIVSVSSFEPKEKIELLEGLMKCYKDRLDTFDFERMIPGTDPRINFRDLIYAAIKYLDKQSSEFKELYFKFFIYDSINAHGQGGLSCAPGIVERLITVMVQPAGPMKDSAPEKAVEYQELINIITNDPHALMITYNKEWFHYHRDSGHPFRADEAPDVIIADFIAFMKEKFKFEEKNDTQKTKIEKLIMEHDLVGVEKIKEMIEGEYLFFAEGIMLKRLKKQGKQGKQGKSGKINIFKLLKERFYFKQFNSQGKKSRKGKKGKKGKKGRKAGKALFQKTIKRILELKRSKSRSRTIRRSRSNK